MFRREISNSIKIDAPPERVWKILTDFKSLSDWNPFIRMIRGTLAAGSRLEVRIRPPGRRETTFRPKILSLEPNRRIQWLGHLALPLIFDGEHTLLIEPIDGDHIRFVQQERFHGVLVPLLEGLLRDTQRGFEEMNKALKERAEQIPS